MGRARYTPTIGRTINFTADSATVPQCLSSSTPNHLAPLGTGLFKTISNQVMINTIEVSGYVLQQPWVTTGSIAGYFPPAVRKILVWFHAPMMTPVGGVGQGALPPLTEVLENQGYDAMYRTDNTDRWTVLWDKIFELGWCVERETLNDHEQIVTGVNKHYYNINLNIEQMVTYADRSTRGSPGGHWSGDSALGRVNTGLIVMYTNVHEPVLMPIIDVCSTRVSYTA